MGFSPPSSGFPCVSNSPEKAAVPAHGPKAVSLRHTQAMPGIRLNKLSDCSGKHRAA